MIRVGIGGWVYEPWRGTFYPADLAQKRELEYASRRLTAIEINSTFYRLASAQSYARWRDGTPEDFVFSVKAPRYATHRKVLAEAGDAVTRFVGSGLEELGTRLGPVVWQLAPTKRFDPADVERFLDLLPSRCGNLPLRHALDARHESFACAEFVALARRRGVAVVLNDSDAYPMIADVTSDFVYARLMRSSAAMRAGYAPAALDRWAVRARAWSAGRSPTDLPRIGKAAKRVRHDVFIFFIAGAKERAPAAALELLKRLQASS